MPLIGLCSLCNALVKTVHIPGKPNKSERKFCPQPPAKGLLSQIIFSCNFVSRSVITRLCREIHHSLINYHCGSLSVGIKTGNLKRSEEHTSELQSRGHLVCRLLLEKKKLRQKTHT